jgi:hypothetical protein
MAAGVYPHPSPGANCFNGGSLVLVKKIEKKSDLFLWNHWIVGILRKLWGECRRCNRHWWHCSRTQWRNDNHWINNHYIDDDG